MPTGLLDWEGLRAVAGMADPQGVLSIYVTLDPRWRAEATAKPPWELELRHQLAQVREQAGRGTAGALAARLEELRLELERLLDPARSGRGRALFAGVADGEVRTVTLQVPLADRVVLEPYAYVRPLLAAWSTAGPAGVVAVSADGLRLVDLRFGWAEEVGSLGYEPPVEQRELKGPAANVPGLAQRGAPQHDLYERREEDKLLRFLRTAGPHVAGEVRQREWEFLVLTGDASRVRALQEGLPPGLPAQVVALDHPVNSLSPARLAELAGPALATARVEHHRELAQRARSNALSANTGAYGLGETLGALQQGQVAHLLLAAQRHWSGIRGPDGLLAPSGEVPPGADPTGTAATEPHLGERMIELALRHSSQVTLLDPAAATPLADADGVGAILRW